MRIISTIAIVCMFFGCKSLEKQRYQANLYFDKFPAELASRCDKQFPVKDSIGERMYDTISTNNLSYKAQIDSLAQLGENAMIQSVFMKRRADSISNACADVVISYMWDIERLNKQIKELAAKYKPCIPDTISITQNVYRRSLARETVLLDSLEQYKYQLGIVTDEFNKQIRETERLNKEKGIWMCRSIFTWIISALALGAGLYMYIKK